MNYDKHLDQSCSKYIVLDLQQNIIGLRCSRDAYGIKYL